MRYPRFVALLSASLLAFVAVAAPASDQTLRIVTYNINADTASGNQIGGPDGGPGLTDVFQAIGQHHLGDGVAQPIDVLALEELDSGGQSISGTLTYLVGQLNSIYGAGTYAYDTFIDPTTGGTGGGPSGLIYNTHTVVDLGATSIGTPSGSGEARAPMRYSLKPVGGAAYSNFYLYVSHAKSGTGTSNADRRNAEAQTVRSDAATLKDFRNLPYAHVLYTGDWNINGGSESTFQTLVASSPSPGQAVDTAIPSNSWSDSQSIINWESESATKLDFRDDLQLVTAPVGTGTGANLTMPGLQMVPGSLEVFGNNGSVNRGGNVSSGSNTALSDLSNRTTILSDLTTATDHLPVVADYTIVPPGDFNRDGSVNAADIGAMMSALMNIPSYESSTGLNAQQLLEIGDVNGDGVINNADIQALIDLVANNTVVGGGSISNGSLAAVPEPASLSLFLAGGWVFLLIKRRRSNASPVV